jgi:helix-turn-helix protein
MDLEERVARLEARLTELEAAPRPAAEDDVREAFFALDALKARVEQPGAVLYTGSVTLPDGVRADWQFGRTTQDVLAADWTTHAATLAALGHPVRLRLLREIVHGRTTVKDLAELDDIGTSGQIYHHLRQLVAEGWLRNTGRGSFGVPPDRVVGLLAILVATER